MTVTGRSLGLVVGLLAGGCAVDPTPLPTELAVAEEAAGDEEVLPLYQALYAAPVLPAPSDEQQRVRLLVWLRHLDLSADQLRRLAELRQLVRDREDRLRAAEAEAEGRYAEQEAEVYLALWDALSRGEPAGSPELTALAERLSDLRAGGARESELLSLRLEGNRSILEAEQPFLATLTPAQETLFADVLFVLRHRLDPEANPGDFRTLVGTVYEPGQYAVLTRGTAQELREPLDIGALWSDRAGLEGRELHAARREVLLYMVLLEPGLDEAVAAALPLAP